MTRIADFLVEKVHLGEATQAERALVLADPDASARLAALPALDRAFLEAHPVDEEVRRIEGRARTAAARAGAVPGNNRAGLASVMVGPLLAAGLALLWVAAPHPPGDPSLGLEQTTAKGPATLRVYRNGPGGVERLGTGAVAHEGDVLQLKVLPGNARYGAVVSNDGRGR